MGINALLKSESPSENQGSDSPTFNMKVLYLDLSVWREFGWSDPMGQHWRSFVRVELLMKTLALRKLRNVFMS